MLSILRTPPLPDHREFRAAPRHPASAVPAIKALRFSSHGVGATLVNISPTGLLAECDERITPGSGVKIVVEGTFVPRLLEGRVARNIVASMGTGGRLRYQVGVEFASPIKLDVLSPDNSPAAQTAQPGPAGPVADARPRAAAAVRNRW